MIRQTHTYVDMPVTAAVMREVRQKLEAAGYDHAISADGDGIRLLMGGIALKEDRSFEARTYVGFEQVALMEGAGFRRVDGLLPFSLTWERDGVRVTFPGEFCPTMEELVGEVLKAAREAGAKQVQREIKQALSIVEPCEPKSELSHRS